MNFDAMSDDEKMDALDKIQASMRDSGSDMNLYAMSDDEKMAALDSIEESLRKSEEIQKQKIAENVDLVIQALKKIESDIQAKYDGVTTVIETRVANIRDGRDGRDGTDGRNGRDGLPGKDGLPGPRGLDGQDGVNGLDGLDGVSVTDARIDFDGSLVIALSSGREINVGEVVPMDLAERIKVITNGGGTSQTVLDTLASLQTQINNISTGNIASVASADGSVTVVTTSGAVDLSVATAASTTNVLVQVRNTTGVTLTKGTAVYISGATGQIPTVSKALADSDATSAQTLGLMTADLANNSNGYVTAVGIISNINTSAYTDGAQLYLSGTTAGTLTATKPHAPTHLVYIAVVEHAHVTQGKLFVKVQNGYEMDELHNVSAQSPSNGQVLVYNTTTSLWESTNTFSASKIIEVTDNTDAALRITQLGTGNALLVEDSANPDASPFVVNASGQVGIGTTAPSAGENLHIAKTVTGATTANVVINDGAVQSDVTASVRMFHTNPSTAAASFNLTTLTHFSANQGTKGAGSTITSQIGFYARNTLTAATTNYGFFSEIAANNTTPGSIDRWSFYSSTAPSYIGGDVLLNGKLGLGSSTAVDYGTSGQVLTSAGSSASPTWTTPANNVTGKSIVMAMIFGL